MLLTFTTMCVLLALTPGPDNIFVATQSIAYGARTGWLITLGLLTGCLWHTSLLAFGFAAMIDRWPELIKVLKFAGGGYLLYLAMRIWWSNSTKHQSILSRQNSLGWYTKGIILNTTNPKVYLFFLSFFPAFLWDECLARPLQVFTLGGIFIATSGVIFALIAILAERFTIMRLWLLAHPAILKGLQTSIFLLLGLNIILS